jgi:small GTP-binding protein
MAIADLKIVLIGSQGVGKTSLVKRSTANAFDENNAATIGASYKPKLVRVGSVQTRLQIWDTAGQERYRAMTPMYYRRISAAVLVYSIADELSFDEIRDWKKSLETHGHKGVPLFLVGNKADLEAERIVSFNDGASLASAIGATFFETSARVGSGVSDLFETVAQQALAYSGHGVDTAAPIESPGNPCAC